MKSSYSTKPIIINLNRIAAYLERNGRILDSEVALFVASSVKSLDKRHDFWVKTASTESEKREVIRKHANYAVGLALALDDFGRVLKMAKAEKVYPTYNEILCDFTKYVYSEELAPFMKESGAWDTLKGVGKGVMRGIFGPWMPEINKQKYLSNTKVVEALEEESKKILGEIKDSDENTAQQQWNNYINYLNQVQSNFARIASEAAVNEDVYNFVLANAVVDGINEVESRSQAAEGESVRNLAWGIIPSFVKTMMNVRRGISKWHTQYGVGGPGNSGGSITGRNDESGSSNDGRYPGGRKDKQNKPLSPDDAFKRPHYVRRYNAKKFAEKHGQQIAERVFKELGIPLDWGFYENWEMDPSIGKPRDEGQSWPKSKVTGAEEAEKQLQENMAKFIQKYPDDAEKILDELGMHIRDNSLEERGRRRAGEGQQFGNSWRLTGGHGGQSNTLTDALTHNRVSPEIANAGRDNNDF